MSAYNDRRRDRERSRSPRRDHHGIRRDDRDDRGYRSERYEGRSNRGSRPSDGGRPGRDDRGPRPNDGGRPGRDDRGGPRAAPPEPPKVTVPSSGRRLPELGSRMVGKSGRNTMILTNHFEILSLPIVEIYHYDIRMKVPLSSQHRGSDKVTAMQQARVLMHSALASFWGDKFVFDGVSKGWSTDEFIPVGAQRSTTIDLSGGNGTQLNEVEITIRNCGTLDVVTFVQYLRKGKIDRDPMGNTDIEPLLKWVNALYRANPASRFITRPHSNAYFERTPETTRSLQSTGDVLEALRGVFQTVQLRFGRLTLNVDTTTTAFWTPNKSLIEMLHALSGVPRGKNIEQWFLEDKARFHHACGRLLGIFFNVKHLKPERNARKVKFSKWSIKGANETTFEQTDKTTGKTQTVSVQDYFRRTYNIRLKYTRLPMADTKDGFIPLELCWSASGERYKEPLEGAETADFIKYATAPAFARSDQIMKNVQKLDWEGQIIPSEHGLSVNTQMLQIPGRILPVPIPQYSSGTDRQAPTMGRWNLRGKRLAEPSSIKAWGLLYLPASREIDNMTLEHFMEGIARGFKELGLSVPRTLPPFARANPQGDMTNAVKEILSKTLNEFEMKPDLIMFLIHSASERLYQAIKNVCDIQFGIASQVMLVEKALKDRGQQQYIANIALKVNVKLGGINSKIVEPMFKKSWMMMGGDTSHPSPAQLRLNPPPPTFSALSGSYDADCTAYTSVASAQFATEQLISDFAVMAKELLGRFQEKNNGRLPESILYYRDGLSESEFSQIIASEAEPLKEVCASFGNKAPKVTVVVVVKRHHTRLFPTEQGDKNGNVMPGTVVENSGGDDIYLVAHPGLQGTVRPTRYAVLLDQNELSADDFQRLTNNLCWTYARSTTAVSVVPPVYYADQACERAKLHLRDVPGGGQILGQVHENLKFSMYWQ